MRFCGNCFKCVTRAVSWGTRHDCFGGSKDAALRRTFKVSFCGFGLLLTLACSTERESLPLSHQKPASATPRVPLPPTATFWVKGTPPRRTLNVLSALSEVVFAGLKYSQEAKGRGETEREETCLWDKEKDTGTRNWAQRDTPPDPPTLLNIPPPRFVPVCSFDNDWRGTYHVNEVHTFPALRNLRVSQWS